MTADVLQQSTRLVMTTAVTVYGGRQWEVTSIRCAAVAADRRVNLWSDPKKIATKGFLMKCSTT